eukprot:414875-Prorocentrum_minimum.AAC.1
MTKSKQGSTRRRYNSRGPKNRREKREAEQAGPIINDAQKRVLQSTKHWHAPIRDAPYLGTSRSRRAASVGSHVESPPPDIESTRRTNLDDSTTLLTSSYTVGKQRNKIRLECSERPLCTLLTATLTGILGEVAAGDKWADVAEQAIRAANGASASRACDYQHASFPNDVGAKERLTKKASAQFGWRRWM